VNLIGSKYADSDFTDRDVSISFLVFTVRL
jgi:hypothetical protein